MTEAKPGGYFGSTSSAIKSVLYNTSAFACASYGLKALIGPNMTKQAVRSALSKGPGGIALLGVVTTGSQLLDSLGNPELASAMGSMADKLPPLREAGPQAARFRDSMISPDHG